MSKMVYFIHFNKKLKCFFTLYFISTQKPRDLSTSKKARNNQMASRSSPYMHSPSIGTIPQTFHKLSSSWDAKVGSRDHTVKIFVRTNQNEPVQHIPAILMALFNDLHEKSDMIKEIHATNPGSVKVGDDNQTLWLYTMRQSDAMPKNSEELERLYEFVRMFTGKHLDSEAHSYVMKHIHISVSFFVWFFTKKNFYYYTKEIRQTTRGGIQKQWRSILLVRVPVVNITQNASVPKVRGDIHQKAILVKLEEEQRKLKADITKVISSTCKADFDDEHELHKTISQCMASGSKTFVGNKQSKKLQKIYNEYMKVTEKVKKTRKSVSQIEVANKKTALTIVVPETNDWGGLGEPPSPPKLIRQNADCLGYSIIVTTQVAEESFDTSIPEPLDDEPPESWEDL